MDRSSQNPAPSIDATRQEDADPWNEFLSESEGTDASPNDAAGSDGSIRSNRPRISVVELVPPRPDPADDFIPEGAVEPTTATPLVEPPASAVAAPQAPPEPEKPLYASRVSPFVRPSGSRLPHHDSGLFTPPASPLPAVAAEPEAAAPPLAGRPQHRATAEAAPADVTAMAVHAEAQMSPAARTVAAAALSSSRLSLADVIARQPSVEWPEAVATVEELCAALLAAGESDDLLVPDLADVFISADGAVAIRTGAAGTRDVTALGKALHALLMGGATPLPLRLFVTSATTPERYRSVALFADALSYYGVPGRSDLIQALYRRANATAPPVAVPRGNLSTRRTAVEISPPAAARPRSPVSPWTIAAIVVLVLAALVGYGVWRAYAAPPVRVEPDTAVEGPPLRDNWLPGGILIDPSSIAEEETPRPSSRRTVRDVPPPTAPVRESAPPPGLTGAVAGAPLPSLLTRVTAPSLPPQTMPAAEREVTAPVSPLPSAPAPVAVSAAPAVPVDSRVYSEADLDVEPPVLQSPRPTLPQRLSPTDTRPDITLELLVDAAGKVQSAKLLDRPTQLSDIGELGPAKLLKFRPATRGGRAVAYRYRLRLSPAVR